MRYGVPHVLRGFSSYISRLLILASRLLFQLRQKIATHFNLLLIRPGFSPTRTLQQLDPFTIVKRTESHVVLREAEAMRFVRANTRIPVPRVYDAWVDTRLPKTGWLLMEYMKGELLEVAWPRMNDVQRQEVSDQLVDFLRQLRSIPSSVPAQIASCSGGPCYDHRVYGGRTFGPFPSEESFHEFLHDIAARGLPADIAVKVPRQLDGHPIVFTHADFTPNQILVDQQNLGRVVALLDWEMAGWFPSYWESMKAERYSGHLKRTTWLDIVCQATGLYFDETEIDWALVDYQGLL